MAARLSEAAQTQYENLEYCNGSPVRRRGCGARRRQGRHARKRRRSPGRDPDRVGCPAALPPAPRRGRPGQADIEMRLQAPLSRPPPAAQRLSPACSEPVPPNLQVLSTDLRLPRARSCRHHPADYGNLELAAEDTLRLRREFGLRLPAPPQSLRRLPRKGGDRLL